MFKKFAELIIRTEFKVMWIVAALLVLAFISYDSRFGEAGFIVHTAVLLGILTTVFLIAAQSAA